MKQSYEEVQKERDALAAQVGELKAVIYRNNDPDKLYRICDNILTDGPNKSLARLISEAKAMALEELIDPYRVRLFVKDIDGHEAERHLAKYRRQARSQYGY